VLDSCTAPSAAGIPLARGALFAAPAGLILVFTPEGTAPFFGSLGLPPMQADRVTVGAVVGRIALFLGVLTGSVARSLVPILLGAIVVVHLLMAFFLSNPHAGWEFSALGAIALVGQALRGEGAFVRRVRPAGVDARRAPVQVGAARTFGERAKGVDVAPFGRRLKRCRHR
jgi:putative oxidoreductase